MKAKLFFTLLIVAVVAGACKKNTTTTDGSFTFKGITYNCTNAVSLLNDFSYVSGTAAANTAVLNFELYGTSATSGVYAVQNTGTGRYATADLVLPIGEYSATGNGMNQTLAFTAGAKGAFKGANIQMVNDNDPTDTAMLTFDVH